MHLSMWTYPWDIQDQGIDGTFADLRDRAGLNTVSLASSYHAGHFFQPRSPRGKVRFPEDGTIYFTPTDSLWEGREIRPLVARNLHERGDMLQALVEARENNGMKVSCWTVCLHNTRLGQLHPEHVTRNAFGNANHYNLCPSSPSARDYVVTLVRDVTMRYQPDMLELESVNFMGFAHEFHHEKDGVGLTEEDDFLLSLCFCEHCMARGRCAGVPMEEVRAIVARLLVETCEREIPERQFPSFPGAGFDAFEALPALRRYLEWRAEPVTSLIAEIKAASDPATQIVVIDLKDGWLGGIDFEAVGKVCDGFLLCCYSMAPEQVRSLIVASRGLLGTDKYLGAGYRLFYPEMPGPDAFADRVRAAMDAGADGLHFYNYGLVPQRRLEWVRRAMTPP